MKNFTEIDPNFDLVNLEKGVLDAWKKLNVFEQVEEKGKDEPEWVYYDGPITANGKPHYGHAITWTMKDVLPRYWSMKGYYVNRNIGWDCQGILVEYEVEKALKFKEKGDIEKYGIDKFNNKCRDSVLSFQGSMIDYETRLGRWLDKKQYATMNPSYIESMWWSIKTLYEKGLLYEGHKVVAYSTRAGMTLSSHEVADGGYKEVVDTSVTAKFKLEGEDKSILAWTTTPWTLPGNLMLAVGKNIDYVEVKVDGEILILAEETLERVLKDRKYEVLSKFKGSELIGKSYVPLFSFYESKKAEGAFKIIHGNHVNTKEGTGSVHLAPYGEDDFNIFLEMGMTLFDYLDEEGHFTDEIPPYSGMFYKKANKFILSDLEKVNKLFEYSDYAHQMPICYRTKEPLIYKPIKSWYLDVQKIKPQLIKEAEAVNIVPSAMKKRFVSWIKGARDWSLLRRRYWGTPMPLWVNDKTGDFKFVGSFAELAELSGQKLPTDFDPHKPFVDDITWEADGGTYKRIPEVLDVWYDSGSMPYAQHHYPFENKDLFEKRYPAEYISESDDQIRLWFYTMFLLGNALFDKTPFKNVVVTGMLGDDEGKKMSKSKGNYPPVEEVFEKYGSDMLRYFLLSSNIARGLPTSFSYDYLNETKKEFFSVLWNSYRYFVTYANLHDFKYEKDLKLENVLDIWITNRLEEVKGNMRGFMDKYEIMYAIKELAPFVNDLSTWYIRRSRDRLSSGDQVALNVLYKCLLDVTKLMAPFMPLFADGIYRNLALSVDENAPVSVHLCEYPKVEVESLDAKLFASMDVVRKVASVGNSIRKLNQLPVKQPLKTMSVFGKGVNELNDDMLALLEDELNVKEVVFVDEAKLSEFKGLCGKGKYVCGEEGSYFVSLDTELTEGLRVEGYARELIREIQKVRKQNDVEWDSYVSVTYKDSDKFNKAVESFGDDIKKKALVKELKPGDAFGLL